MFCVLISAVVEGNSIVVVLNLVYIRVTWGIFVTYGCLEPHTLKMDLIGVGLGLDVFLKLLDDAHAQKGLSTSEL